MFGPTRSYLGEYYWLVVPTPLQKNQVSWDYDLPNIWKNKIHVPNHQPDYDAKYDE